MPTPSRSMAVRLTTAGCAAWPSGVKNHSTGVSRSRLATTVQPRCSRNCALGSARKDSSTAATLACADRGRLVVGRERRVTPESQHRHDDRAHVPLLGYVVGLTPSQISTPPLPVAPSKRSSYTSKSGVCADCMPELGNQTEKICFHVSWIVATLPACRNTA